MTTVESVMESPSVQRPRLRLGVGMAISASAYVLGGVLGVVGALSTSAGAVTPDPTTHSVLTLFSHNLGVLVLLCVGMVSAGIISTGVMGLNGLLLGWVVAKQMSIGQGDTLLTGILPHLPFELLAYVVSAGATLRISMVVAGWFFKRRTMPLNQWVTWLAAQAVAAGLLLVGAIVESNFSHV